MIDMKKRIAGALFGVAVGVAVGDALGDALGGPVEFMGPDQIATSPAAKPDSFIDLAGYTALAGEIMTRKKEE